MNGRCVSIVYSMCQPLASPCATSFCTYFSTLMKKEKDWFKLKRYPHIGQPLKQKDRTWVTNYVTDPKCVATHRFFPFIHRSTTTRKFRRVVDKRDGTRSRKRVASLKTRELYYANHLDSCVYGYYAQLLNTRYEVEVVRHALYEVVTAYRRIEVDPKGLNTSHKSNADFAADVFNFILNHQSEHLVAITLDIRGFFDNLDHKLLKKAWYSLNCKPTLSESEFKIFKSITSFSFVNEKQLFKEFKTEIITESKTGIQRKRSIKRIHHLRNQGAVAFCECKDIKRIKSKGLLVANGIAPHEKRKVGIPQGSPISAVLANVYMLEFDKKINTQIENWGGLYRRYSDDMIVICDASAQNEIIELFTSEIASISLEIQKEKTQIFTFNKVAERFVCTQKVGVADYPHKNLEYLGFEFDGLNTYLKSSSLSSFYRKMKRSHSRSAFYSKTLLTSKSKGDIFKTRLYKRFSYKGASRKRIYKQDPSDPKKWVKTSFHNWGNYISYANMAMNKLPNNKIKGQIKRHWKILNKLISPS